MNAILNPLTRADVPTVIGQPFLDGTYGGLVYEYGETFAVCWPSKTIADLDPAQWAKTYEIVEGASHYVDGHANTIAMALAGNEVAQRVLAMNADDSLPPVEIAARDVLELGYRYFKPTTDANYASFRDGENPSSFPVGYPYTKQAPVQTNVEAFKAGGPEAFEAVIYFSSTQYSAYVAWIQGFGDGIQTTSYKDIRFRFRLARRLKLS